MAALTAALDDEAQEVEDYSAEFDSVSSFASVAGSPRAAAVAAGEDYSTDSFASFAGSPRAAQVVADDYSEDFESPRAAAAGGGLLGGLRRVLQRGVRQRERRRLAHVVAVAR